MQNSSMPYETAGVKHATINGIRFHLRTVDPTEDNFLWINGKQPPIILDKTAADFVAYMIEAMWNFQQGSGDESTAVMNYVVEKMYMKYKRLIALPGKMVTRNKISADFHKLFGTLMSIAEGGCPAEAGLTSKEIRYGDWSCPGRMDLALLYRCNLSCPKCYLPEKADKTMELSTSEWKGILTKLWMIGIPQVVFTGGEPTLRADLVDLVDKAKMFVTGLITNGTRLAENDLAGRLKEASLDYVQITVESSNSDIHDKMVAVPGSFAKTLAGIHASLKAGIDTVTNTTITATNKDSFIATMKFLSDIGVKNIACNTLICSGRGTEHKKQNGVSDEELKNILLQAKETADALNLNLQWYSPTCYNAGINPLELGLGEKACSAAAYNMTIQPDGSVLPCQSWPEPVGNILRDSWSEIWNHPTCIKLRKNMFKPESCGGCVYEMSCRGGCPLDKSQRKRITRLDGGEK